MGVVERLIALLVILGLAACAARSPSARNGAASPTAADGTPALPIVLALPNYPLRLQDRSTTDAGVYIGNLRARLAGLESRADRQQSSVLAQRASTHFLLHRIEGRPADLAVATRLAAAAVQSNPDEGAAWMIQAAVLAYLHRFEEANAALAEAERTSMPATEIAQLRRSIATALGEPPPAPDGAPVEISRPADAIERAHQCVELGDLQCASEHFHLAQFLDNDSSPFPLAWLHTQQGIALLRFGHPAAAIRFFEAALERLPGYYVAMEHLAECQGLVGNFAESRRWYEAVIDQTAHPEYMAGFAGMLEASGDHEAARQWRTRATVGYGRLLKEHPAAYAGHAIGFFIEHGQIATALTMARENLQIRQDVGSWLALAEAAAAAGACAESRDALARAMGTGWRPPELDAVQAAVRNCLPRG